MTNQTDSLGVGYLSDDQGRPSAVRLYGMICVSSGVLLAFAATWLDSWVGASLAMSLVGATFTGKVAQKAFESVNKSQNQRE